MNKRSRKRGVLRDRPGARRQGSQRLVEKLNQNHGQPEQAEEKQLRTRLKGRFRMLIEGTW